jgi:hypothetical protein
LRPPEVAIDPWTVGATAAVALLAILAASELAVLVTVPA